MLQKKTSDPSSPNFKVPQDPGGEESSASSSKQQNMLVGSQGPAQAKSSSWKHPSLDDLVLDENEAAELKAWMVQGVSSKPEKGSQKR